MKPPRIDVISSHGQKINCNFDEFMNGGHKNEKRDQKSDCGVLRPPDGAGAQDRVCPDSGVIERQIKHRPTAVESPWAFFIGFRKRFAERLPGFPVPYPSGNRSS